MGSLYYSFMVHKEEGKGSGYKGFSPMQENEHFWLIGLCLRKTQRTCKSTTSDHGVRALGRKGPMKHTANAGLVKGGGAY